MVTARASISEVLRAQRTKLGLSETFVAQRIGLSFDEYRDVEQHEDEALSVLRLRHLRLLCSVLDLDVLDLLNVPCAFCADSGIGLALGRERHDLVRARREALGLTQAEVADRIGFEAGILEDIERDPEYLDGWSSDLIVSLAKVLGLPPQCLLNVRCRRCGR